MGQAGNYLGFDTTCGALSRTWTNVTGKRCELVPAPDDVSSGGQERAVRLGDHESQCTQHLGAVAQHAGHHLGAP
jgi:hypothetical protein